MDGIGYWIMMVLLGAGAAFGLANKGQPRPALSATKKKVAIICFAVGFGCIAFGLLVAMTAQSGVSH